MAVNMGKVMIIDINKCNGCYNCQLSCKDEHVGNDWTPIAKPQPDTGHFWYKITEIVQGSVPKVRVRYMHDLCQHCDAAPCIAACNHRALYKRDDGIVILDPEKCRGSRACISACPYKAIYYNTDLNISQKCTFCAHLLDDGWTEPRCVQSCPTDALIFGEESELGDLIAKAELLNPGLKTGPRVYYIGLPNKYFIAGEVYDPDADECLEGAVVTLTDAAGIERARLETDVFGDFWFERQTPGRYSLEITMPGYAAKSIDEIDASKDVNVGSIELRKS
jgi:Fe-S-cluster-containing dehydrogenase component